MILKIYGSFILLLFINYVLLPSVSSLNNESDQLNEISKINFEENGTSDKFSPKNPQRRAMEDIESDGITNNIQRKSINYQQYDAKNTTAFEYSIDLSVEELSNIIVNVTCEAKNIDKTKIVLPDGYKWVDGLKDAYKPHTDKVTWAQAHRICTNERAHLAFVESKEEEEYFLYVVKNVIPDHIWIGFHDIFMEGYWMTVLDQPVHQLNYVRWYKHNPDNFDGNENCATWGEHGINDIKCTFHFGFVCKIFASSLDKSSVRSSSKTH